MRVLLPAASGRPQVENRSDCAAETLEPRGNGGPGGSTCRDPREDCWGKEGSSSPWQGVYVLGCRLVRRSERASVNNRNRRNLGFVSCSTSPKGFVASLQPALLQAPPRLRPRLFRRPRPPAGQPRRRPPTEAPPLPPVPPLPAPVWAPGTPKRYRTVCESSCLDPCCVDPGAPLPSRQWGSARGRPRVARTARLSARAQPSGPAAKSSRVCASRLSCGIHRAQSRVSAGLARGAGNVTCERGGSQPRPCARLSPPLCICSVPEPQSRAFRFADGKLRPRCSGGRSRCRAALCTLLPRAVSDGWRTRLARS